MPQMDCHQTQSLKKENRIIANVDIRQMFNVSAATANRILAKMSEYGKLKKIRNGKSWGYIKNRD